MKRLGHHCYTSIGGYKTVHCSPWLESVRGVLDRRAQACYSEVGRFDCIRRDGLWIATFVLANGVDHVRRPRTLVHQVVFESANEPPVFSPFFLKLACLERLDHEDPALEHRLVTDLDQLNLREHMPHPQQFGAALQGDTVDFLLAFYESVMHAEEPETCLIKDIDSLLETIRPGSCLATIHGVDFHVSSLQHPLDNYDLPSVHIVNEMTRQCDMDSSILLPSSSRCILDIFLEAEQPHLFLFLFRHLSLRQLVEGEGTHDLFRLVLEKRVCLDPAGFPLVNEHFPELARVLMGLGGSAVLQHVLRKWLETAGMLSEPALADDCEEYLNKLTSAEALTTFFTFLEHYGIVL